MEPAPAVLLPESLREQRLHEAPGEERGEPRLREQFGSMEESALAGTYLVL